MLTADFSRFLNYSLHLANSSQTVISPLLIVRERKVDKFGGISRLGRTMIDVLHKSQRFFVTVDQRQGVLHWNDSQQLKTTYQCNTFHTLVPQNLPTNSVKAVTSSSCIHMLCVPV